MEGAHAIGLMGSSGGLQARQCVWAPQFALNDAALMKVMAVG